tara:strand:- start:319 stop:489 length:171 start_codon:yes stop_codon:yes gene_type:complete
MTEKMIQEIVDDWEDWKHDIYENNKSTWTQRDDKKINIISEMLKEQLEFQKAVDRK